MCLIIGYIQIKMTSITIAFEKYTWRASGNFIITYTYALMQTRDYHLPAFILLYIHGLALVLAIFYYIC